MGQRLGRRRFLRLVSATAATTVPAWLAACRDAPADPGTGRPEGGAGAATPTPLLRASGGTLRLAVSADPDSLDPLLYNTSVAGITIRNMTETLVRFTTDRRIAPGLVHRWEIAEGGTHYTFHLRPGIAFDDGTACDAEAVCYNLARYSGTVSSPWYSDLAGLQSVEVIDPVTLALDFDAANAPLLSKLPLGAGIVVSPAVVEQRGDRLRGDFTNAGCGPWSFESWQPGIGLIASRNPHFWESDNRGTRLPYLDRLELRPLADENRRLEALRANQVDAIASYTGGPPPAEVARIKREPELLFQDESGLGYTGLYLNLGRPPFDRREVRQALALAIDRAELVGAILPDVATPNDTVIPPPQMGSDPTFHPYLQRDLARARALLAGAGLSRVPFTLTYRGDSPRNQQIVEVIQQQIAAPGFVATLDPAEGAAITARLRSGDFHCSFGGWSGFIDPDGQVYSSFHSQGSNNRYRYRNAALDSLLDSGRRTLDPAARAPIYHEVNRILAEDLPVVVLYNGTNHTVTRRAFRDFPLGPAATIRFPTVWKQP